MIKYLCSTRGKDYGIIGNPTSMKDSSGNQLYVGDIIVLETPFTPAY